MRNKNFRKRSHEEDEATENNNTGSEDDEQRRLALEEIKFLQKQRERKSGIPAIPASLQIGAGGGLGEKADGDGEKEELVLQDTFAPKPGDWNCRSCQHLNFSRRDSCQRCGDPKSGGGVGDFGSFGGRGSSSFGFSGSDVRPGDWYCSAGNCGAHNFASRSSCFKCGAFKDESAGGFDGDMPRSRAAFPGGRSGWKSGDWICARSGWNEHNFASRMECFRCNAPRYSGSKSPYAT